MLELADTSPTLPELSTLLRERPRLSQRLRLRLTLSTPPMGTPDSLTPDTQATLATPTTTLPTTTLPTVPTPTAWDTPLMPPLPLSRPLRLRPLRSRPLLPRLSPTTISLSPTTPLLWPPGTPRSTTP